MDLFEWEIASWDFLSNDGESIVSTQDHSYESGALANPWKSLTVGPHQSLTLVVDYHNAGVGTADGWIS